MRQADDSGFGCRVVRAHGASGLRRYRRQIDDASPLPCSHACDYRLGDQEDGFQVHAENLVPLGFSDFFKRSGLRDRGIVHQNVD